MNKLKRWVILHELRKLEKDIKGGKIMTKRGIFTSEFWVTLATTIITLFADHLGVDPQVRDAIIKIAVAYIASRTAVKVSSGITKKG